MFDCGFKFGGPILKDFVVAFVIRIYYQRILEGLKVRFLYFTLDWLFYSVEYFKSLFLYPISVLKVSIIMNRF